MGLFEKQARLTGRDKIAVFMASLGVVNTKGLMKYFSTSELKRIRLALKKVKVYNSGREIRVLEEAVRYGLNKRLTDADPVILNQDDYAQLHAFDAMKRAQEERQSDLLRDSDTVASVISKWIDADSNSGSNKNKKR